MGDTAGDDTAAGTTSRTDVDFDVLVRPRVALIRSTVLSLLFSAVPLTVALVWVAFPVGLWAAVATVVIGFGVLSGVLFVRLRTAYVGVGATQIAVRGVITPARVIPRDAVDRVVVATTFGGSPDRTTRELLALDPHGTTLFRMRAVVWDDAGLEQVSHALGVQVSEGRRPVSVRDLMRRYPSSRTWYERPHPYLGFAALVVLTVAVVAVVDAIGPSGH